MLLSGLFVLSLRVLPPIPQFHAGAMDLTIDNSGYVRSLTIAGSENIVASEAASPLLQLRVSGKLEQPTSARWNRHRQVLSLHYTDHEAQVTIEKKGTHLSFELTQVRPLRDVEVVVWGPYSTKLKDSIGETIGVVQGKGLAFGLQILNAKTLGGFPNTEDDIEPSYSIFDTNNVVDMNDKDAATENYRGDTARPTEYGSVVQAYVRNRSKTRIISNWAHPFYTAPAFKDGGVIGSKIALFGSTDTGALATIGHIEEAEGLPHPIIDGVWGKISPTAHEAYLVMGYDLKNLDECLAITKQAGLRYLYSDSCFDTWGHFKLNPKGFPKNWESMKQCVERAKSQGVRLGVHTLSNFITPNDAYVTPVPDKRLAEVGASKLVDGINATDTELLIEDPMFFNEMANNTLKTVRLGDELIQYDSVTTQAPWRLLKCKRGAFGTHARRHDKGERIAKLMDHGYGTFLTDASLSQEVAKNIAKLFSKTGLLQLSMDGLEGNWSTGMGQYGRALFAQAWYDNLAADVKGQVINDASNPSPYNWHINTRENWGEPWYAGFRKSQTLYRLKNQHYFKRNLMPGMLGWFQLTSETTTEDIQWLLARAAGFDAGFCITTSLGAVKANPHATEILGAVKAWESARRAHAFPAELQSKLQDINNEFNLSQIGPRKWALTAVQSDKFTLSGSSIDRIIAIPARATDYKLIVQVPDKAKFENIGLLLDGTPVQTHWGTTVNGYRYLSIEGQPDPHLPHTLHLTGTLVAPSNGALDCELRTPLSEFRTLEPPSFTN